MVIAGSVSNDVTFTKRVAVLRLLHSKNPTMVGLLDVHAAALPLRCFSSCNTAIAHSNSQGAMDWETLRKAPEWDEL